MANSGGRSKGKYQAAVAIKAAQPGYQQGVRRLAVRKQAEASRAAKGTWEQRQGRLKRRADFAVGQASSSYLGLPAGRRLARAEVTRIDVLKARRDRVYAMKP